MLPALPAFVPAQWPGSQTLVFQQLWVALSYNQGRLEVEGRVGWGQGTINLPACMYVLKGLGRGWVESKIHVLFWELGLGSDKSWRGGRFTLPKGFS